MIDHDRLTRLQDCIWTLELLTEVLDHNDLRQECGPEAQLSFRCVAGVHDAIRIISRLAAEHCGKLIEQNEGLISSRDQSGIQV